jgi:hypothetical protein
MENLRDRLNPKDLRPAVDFNRMLAEVGPELRKDQTE